NPQTVSIRRFAPTQPALASRPLGPQGLVEEGAILGEHVLLPRLDGNREAVLLRRHRAVEGVRETAGRQTGLVEVEQHPALRVRCNEEKPADAVRAHTAGRV